MDDRDRDGGLELGAQLDELLGGEIQRQGLIQRRNTGKIQRRYRMRRRGNFGVIFSHAKVGGGWEDGAD